MTANQDDSLTDRRPPLVQTRISEEAFKALQQAAATETRTIAAWLRRVIYERLGFASSEEDDDAKGTAP